jgi:hypothetical protein
MIFFVFRTLSFFYECSWVARSWTSGKSFTASVQPDPDSSALLASSYLDSMVHATWANMKPLRKEAEGKAMCLCLLSQLLTIEFDNHGSQAAEFPTGQEIIKL